MKGDVYPDEPYEGHLKNQVLDAHWGVLHDEDVSIVHYFIYVIFLTDDISL